MLFYAPMGIIRILAAALLLLGATEAVAQTAAESCPRPAASWTTPEANVFRLLCTTGKADITPPYGRMEPPVAGQPVPDYVLNGTFLRQILTEPPYRDVIKSAYIKGAYVVGLLEFTGRNIPMPLTFEETHMPDGIVLDQVNADGAVAFLNSFFPSGLGWRNGTVRGLSFDGSVVQGALDITNTLVTGNVSARNGKFEAFVGRAVKISGALDLTGTETAEIVLPSARVGTDAKLAVAGNGLRLVTLSGFRAPGQMVLTPTAPWLPDARLLLSNASIGTLVPPKTWAPNTDLADIQVDRTDAALATFLLDRMQKSGRATDENYQQLAVAARAGGADAVATQIDGIVRERVRARASTTERFFMTVEDLGWISGVIGLAILAGIGWLTAGYVRRKREESAG